MNDLDSMVMFRPPSDSSQSIMVLDLCGSSGMANTDEVMAVHLRRRVEQLASPVLLAHQVSSVKNTGDGFLATFSDTICAIRAAVHLMSAFDERNRRTVNPPIRVRIALHYGTTYSVFDSGVMEIYGNDVNIVFRLEALQKKAIEKPKADFPECDRILCTGPFRDRVYTTSYVSHVRFTDCGQAQLKGINELIEVYWISPAGDDSRIDS